ncbi:MAG: ABC transporter substrate-binding protein [bacterium]|nr:ABC transporter substrate-binding protein [bacterium]
MKWFKNVLTFTLLVSVMMGAFGALAQDGGVLRVGMTAPVVLDPAQHSNDPETALNRAIYDYLVEVLPDSTIGGNIASDWTISDDGLTYTFNLVEGVTFHNGDALTSADVVYTFNRLQEVSSPAISLLGEFEVSAPDASTVVFTLASPNADFLYGVAARQALIVQDGEDQPNVLGEGDAAFENFNGTGPFILTQFDPGARAVFEANPNYWRGAPALSGLEFIFIDDAVAQVDALLSGELDFIFKVPIAQTDRIEAADGVSVVNVATSQHPVIRLRTDEGFAGADARVLQAFKYATDRDALNDILLQGRGTVGNNDPIAPVFTFFYDDTVENQTYDPQRACELLEEAGIGTYEGTLYAPNAFEYADLAAVLQQQWAAACINVDIQVTEEGLYYDFSNPNNYFEVELGITGWGDRPSPQILLQQAYIASGIETGFNESRFSDPEVETLVEEARVTTDNEARRAIYARISEIFLERGPIIVPYFAPLFGGLRDTVQGLVMNPFPGSTDFRTVSIGG